MAARSIEIFDMPLVAYCLRRADDGLVLGHRLSEWCGHAPTMEEDMALANMGLDLLGQARSLYTYAAEVEGAGNDEDRYAYLREVGQYRNLLLAEQPNGDFAVTIVRQFLYSAFADPFWQAMVSSTNATLAAIAAKSEKESAYHLRHSAEWVVRLGDGTAESHRRAQAGIDAMWPYTGEMFERDQVERELSEAGVAVNLDALRGNWDATLDEVLARATLVRPASGWMQTGGRHGRHGEHLGHLLAELQHLQRADPGAKW